MNKIIPTLLSALLVLNACAPHKLIKEQSDDLGYIAENEKLIINIPYTIKVSKTNLNEITTNNKLPSVTLAKLEEIKNIKPDISCNWGSYIRCFPEGESIRLEISSYKDRYCNWDMNWGAVLLLAPISIPAAIYKAIRCSKRAKLQSDIEVSVDSYCISKIDDKGICKKYIAKSKTIKVECNSKSCAVYDDTGKQLIDTISMDVVEEYKVNNLVISEILLDEKKEREEKEKEEEEAKVFRKNCPGGSYDIGSLYSTNPYNVKGKCFDFAGKTLQITSKDRGFYRIGNSSRIVFINFKNNSAPPNFFSGNVKGTGILPYKTTNGSINIVPKLEVLNIYESL